METEHASYLVSTIEISKCGECLASKPSSRGYCRCVLLSQITDVNYPPTDDCPLREKPILLRLGEGV